MLYVVFVVPLALADPPPSAESAPATETAPEPAPAVVAPPETAAHTASSAKLLGAACSYTTGLMARRVLEQGAEWNADSNLLPAASDGDARIAAPYTIAEDASVHLIATELLEALTNDASAGTTVKLGGRMMEVDGVRYVVLTSYQGFVPAP